jgi:hypothetical protein
MIGHMKRERILGILEVVVLGSLMAGSFWAFSQSRQIDASASRPDVEGLLVPPRLEASIKATFPSYRIPEDKDITGGWAVDKKLGTSSFFCLGDFNGDGSEDAAIILIGEQTWRLVVFERGRSGEYRPAFIARPKTKQELGKYWTTEILLTPQQMLLRKVRKGETWAPEAGDDPHLGRLKVDAIELTAEPKPNARFASLLIWEKGKYHQVFSDPLVELSAASAP